MSLTLFLFFNIALLKNEAQKFEKVGKDIKRKMWWKNFKVSMPKHDYNCMFHLTAILDFYKFLFGRHRV